MIYCQLDVYQVFATYHSPITFALLAVIYSNSRAGEEIKMIQEFKGNSTKFVKQSQRKCKCRKKSLYCIGKNEIS